MEGTSLKIFEQCLHQCVNPDVFIHPPYNPLTAIECQAHRPGHWTDSHRQRKMVSHICVRIP